MNHRKRKLESVQKLEQRKLGNARKIVLVAVPVFILVVAIATYYYYIYYNSKPTTEKSHSYIMDLPAFPTDTVPKPQQGRSDVVFGWFPWTHGICYDDEGMLLWYHISISTEWARYTFMVKGVTYSGSFDLAETVYNDGVLTFHSPTAEMMIDYHVPHNVTIISTPTDSSISFISTYRGPPLWYSKSLEPDDMLPVPESSGRLGGYDAPIKIEGHAQISGLSLDFSGFGDWEHVWFLQGGWVTSHRLWMVLNSEKYYCVVAEIGRGADDVAWHIGRFAEVDGSAYVFDDFDWVDDGRALPLFVALRGPIRDNSGNVVGNIDLAANPQKSKEISSIWVIYEDVSGSILGTAFVNGTAWAEIDK